MTDPNEAYGRSELDARISSGKSSEIVLYCLGQVIAGIGAALSAQQRNNPTARSKALTRALTAITALEMGVDRAAPMASALIPFYAHARRTVLDCVVGFDSARLETVRTDFADVMAAMAVPAAA